MIAMGTKWNGKNSNGVCDSSTNITSLVVKMKELSKEKNFLKIENTGIQMKCNAIGRGFKPR